MQCNGMQCMNEKKMIKRKLVDKLLILDNFLKLVNLIEWNNSKNI